VRTEKQAGQPLVFKRTDDEIQALTQPKNDVTGETDRQEIGFSTDKTPF
jgi:hypothetical protein